MVDAVDLGRDSGRLRVPVCPPGTNSSLLALRKVRTGVGVLPRRGSAQVVLSGCDRHAIQRRLFGSDKGDRRPIANPYANGGLKKR